MVSVSEVERETTHRLFAIITTRCLESLQHVRKFRWLAALLTRVGYNHWGPFDILIFHISNFLRVVTEIFMGEMRQWLMILIHKYFMNVYKILNNVYQNKGDKIYFYVKEDMIYG